MQTLTEMVRLARAAANRDCSPDQIKSFLQAIFPPQPKQLRCRAANRSQNRPLRQDTISLGRPQAIAKVTGHRLTLTEKRS